MQVINASEAKTQFGDLLLKAQRSPVQIHKHGKPVAMVLSMHEYASLEALKLDNLKRRATRADEQIRTVQLRDGDAIISKLLLNAS